MGKGKKSSGKQYVSKGERKSSVSTKVRDSSTRLMNQQKAWMAGKNVVVTIENPNKNQTNKRFIKVNARDVWGNPKRNISPMI
jgi:hypothetical protein